MFKDFSFELPVVIGGKPPKDTYDLVKWQTESGERKTNFVVATISYNDKEPSWEFKSCGMKFLKYYEDGLNEFVIKYIELLDLQKRYHDKEMEEFYAHY